MNYNLSINTWVLPLRRLFEDARVSVKSDITKLDAVGSKYVHVLCSFIRIFSEMIMIKPDSITIYIKFKLLISIVRLFSLK